MNAATIQAGTPKAIVMRYTKLKVYMRSVREFRRSSSLRDWRILSQADFREHLHEHRLELCLLEGLLRNLGGEMGELFEPIL